MIENDKIPYDIFYAVDKMYHGDVTLPKQLADLDDVRLIKDSSPHDALYNATVALANSRIDLNVTPLGDAEDEFVKANKMEEVLKWNWEYANMRGMSRKIWDIAHSALRYDLCITRVDDLYYWLPKDQKQWSKPNKRAAKMGRFLITVLPPHKVHFQISQLSGTFCIVSARNMPLDEILDYYEALAGDNKEGKKIKATIKKIKSELGDVSAAEQRAMLYQYTDDDKRLDFCYLTDTDVDQVPNTAPNDTQYVFIDTENKIPFMNYTVRGGASDVETGQAYKYHPMLASSHWYDGWLNSMLATTLTFSDIIRRLRETREFYIGAATDQVPADDGLGGAKPLPPGVNVQRPSPTQVDPQAMQVIDQLKQALSATTSASALGNMNRYANAAFSTMNAIVQVEMGKLNPQKNIIQDTIADQCKLFCEWSQFTKKPLQSWRDEAKKIGGQMMPRGQEIQIGNNDYDLMRTFIKCSITPETPTDKAQTMNIVKQLIEIGMSAEEGMEMLNIPHADLQKDKRALEILKDGAIQALIAKMQQMKAGEAQLWLQEQMMKMQQAQQPPQAQPPGQGPPPEGSQFPGGEGFDPNMGGQPPAQSVPGVGREQLNGTTRSGQDIAA